VTNVEPRPITSFSSIKALLVSGVKQAPQVSGGYLFDLI